MTTLDRFNETNGGQANFVPGGPPNGVPTYLIPASGKDNRTLSASFLSLLAKDGIKLESTDQYGQGLLQDAEVQLCSPCWLRISGNSEVRHTRRLWIVLQFV